MRRSNAKYFKTTVKVRAFLDLVEWKRREEVIGKDVIDGDAKKLGVTKDLAWSNDGRMALVIETDEDEFFLSFSEIERIGDVVFVKARSALAAAPSVICPVCKHKNLPEAKFCAKCGRTLEAKDRKRSQTD
jgi:sporulation protein YlmC with PRC-barrel domain